MRQFFSPSSGGFYDPRLHRSIPDDAIEISSRQHRAMLDAQADGKRIACVDGKVRAITPPPPSGEERIMLVRRRRDRLLAATDRAVSVPDFPISEPKRQEIRRWRSALRSVTEAPDPVVELDRLIGPGRPAWIDGNGAIISKEAL